MVTQIFQLLLLLSPICVGADIDMDMFDIIFFRTGIIVLFMASLLDKPKREMPAYINKIILGLLGLCLMSSFVHTFQPIILHNFLNLFLAIVGFYIVYVYLDEKKNLIKYILTAGIINLCFSISQRLGFDPIFNKVPQVGGGFLGNIPRLANYFTLIIPFLSLPFVLASILLVWFTGQLVILIPITLIIFMKIKDFRKRIIFGAILILIMIAIRQHIYTSLVNTRFIMFWKPALEAFFDRPLIGYGLGNTMVKDAGSVFNSYLQFIVGVGIFGLVWFGYVFKSIYKKIKNNTESIALLTLGLIMFIEYVCEIPRLWFTIIAIIIMFLLKQETGNVS